MAKKYKIERNLVLNQLKEGGAEDSVLVLDANNEVGSVARSEFGGGGGVSQNLQEVTDLGNTTNKKINVGGLKASLPPVSSLTEVGEVFKDLFPNTSLNPIYSTTMINGTDYNIGSNSLNVISGGILFNKYLEMNKFIGITKWTQEIIFKVNTYTTTTYGVGLGIKSTNGNTGLAKSSFVAQLFLQNDSLKGKVRFYSDESSTTVITTSASALAFSVNDVIKLQLIRNENLMTMVALNVTKGLSITHSYIYDLNNTAGPLVPNTGKLRAYFFSGSYTVSSYSYVNNGYKNGLVFIGDSVSNSYKTLGFSSGFVPNSVNSNTWNICGGQADRTIDVQPAIDNLVSENTPTIAVIALGQNDAGFSYGVSNYSAQLQLIINKLTAIGCTVYLLTPYPRTGVDQTSYITACINVADSNSLIYVNAFSLLKDSASTNYNPLYAADSVHPNATGHTLIADEIRKNFPAVKSLSNYIDFEIENLRQKASEFSRLGIDSNNQLVKITDTAFEEINTIATASLSSATLNTQYPEALLLKKVYCPNISPPTVYTKISATLWQSQTLTIV